MVELVTLSVIVGIFVVSIVAASHILLVKDFPLYRSKYREMVGDENVVIVKSLPDVPEGTRIVHFDKSNVLMINDSFYFDEGSLVGFMPVFCHPYSLYWYIKYKRLVKRLEKEGKLREL